MRLSGALHLIHRRQKGPTPSPYAAVAVWLFLSFLVFYAALTRGHFFTTDEIDVYQQTRSLWTSGDLSTEVIPNTFPGRDGRNFAPYGVGQSFLALSLYGLGSDAYRLLKKSGGQTWIRIFAGSHISGRRPRLTWPFTAASLTGMAVALRTSLSYGADTVAAAAPGQVARGDAARRMVRRCPSGRARHLRRDASFRGQCLVRLLS